MDESTHLSVTIDRPWREVYDFAANPANLPQWAAGLAESTVEEVDGKWIADSPMGRVGVEFTGPNPFGVLDHNVTLPSGGTVTNPVRVFPNGDGCDVVFTVRRRPGMSAEDLERDSGQVAADLETLRRLMEE
jgi:Polyketide cyclase / dehydrase and lipid transport